MSVLKIEDVSFAYGETMILDNISLKLEQGEVVSILGESGSGKTTLFNLAAGLLKPIRGSITLNDQTIHAGSMGYMLQKDLLLPYKKVEDNIALPLLLRNIKKKEALDIVGKHLVAFGLQGTEKKYPHQLSGGMRQRAALLRTYLFDSDAMLLDEPFSALDPLTRRKMHARYLEVMQSIQKTTLLITHDVDEAIYLSDTVYVLKGKPAQLSHPIKIPFPRPRTYEMLLDNEFLVVKREIMKTLHDEEETGL